MLFQNSRYVPSNVIILEGKCSFFIAIEFGQYKNSKITMCGLKSWQTIRYIFGYLVTYAYAIYVLSRFVIETHCRKLKETLNQVRSDVICGKI